MISNKINFMPERRKDNDLKEPNCKSIEYLKDDISKKESIAESIKNFVAFNLYNTENFSNIDGLFTRLFL